MGLTLIIGALVHIIFLALNHEPITEKDVMLAVGAIFAGIGFISAGDASKSKQDTKDVDKKVDATAAAVLTGDTTFLPKPSAPEADKPKDG